MFLNCPLSFSHFHFHGKRGRGGIFLNSTSSLSHFHFLLSYSSTHHFLHNFPTFTFIAIEIHSHSHFSVVCLLISHSLFSFVGNLKIGPLLLPPILTTSCSFVLLLISFFVGESEFWSTSSVSPCIQSLGFCSSQSLARCSEIM